MAEELQTGICGGNWWNAMTIRSTSGGGGIRFDGQAVAVTAAEVVSVSCSTEGMIDQDEMVSYGWRTTGVAENSNILAVDSSEQTTRSSSEDFSVALLQDGGHKPVGSVPMVTGSCFIDPSLSTINWNQALLQRNGTAAGIAHQNGFIHHPMLHEEQSPKQHYFHQVPSTELHANQIHMGGGMVDDMSQAYMIENHHTNSGNDSNMTVNSIPVSSVDSYGGSPAVYLQGMFDPQQLHNTNHSQSYCSTYEVNQSPSASWSKFPQFFKPSQPLLLTQLKQHHKEQQQQQHQQQQQAGQLQFSNNTAFWNAPATSDTKPAGFFPKTTKDQFFSSQSFEPKPINSTSNTVTSKSFSESGRDTRSPQKKGGNEPSLKKPRVETPSPLPTFKVRKEKLSDRVTALQQMVSPFGKTDTASVLFDAIEYIKYLHDQVNVLSSPYMKNGDHMQPQKKQINIEKFNKDDGGSAHERRPKQDLRSRGLCLVPIANTFSLANIEPMAEFFIPAFGGSYR